MVRQQELDNIEQEIEALRGQVTRLRQGLNQQIPDSALDREATRQDDSQTLDGISHQSASERIRRWCGRAASFAVEHPYDASLILLLLIGLAIGLHAAWNYFESYESTSDAEISGHISPVSSKVDGIVTKVLVQNDQFVKDGQPLIELDQHDYQLLVTIAQAKFDAADAEADIARHSEENLESNAGRQSKSIAGLPQGMAKTAYAAKKAYSVKLATKHAAEASLDQARLKLKYTTITAPVSGTVAECSVNIGQVVQPAQRLLTVVQPGNIWVTARFKETQLRRLRHGQAATIHVDALGRDYQGYVASLAPATTSEFSLLPPENATGNYVKVVQRIAARIEFKPGQDLSGLKPGMSVEPTVRVNNG
ncbi:MAG TPA: HlyD family secretion protein [Candidatus Binataceae bacterium]|nr:HlyD family secretion protein [Candidatus Binataceae bacterium]